MTASSGSIELRDVRRLGLRGAVLVFPFMLALVLELFVLPIDFFTFRVWEAALATPYRYPGAYYPNLHVKKAKEYGDHYRQEDPKLVQSKPVEWFTDAYGFRNRPEIERCEKYDAVVLGDSNIVGTSLDQKDIVTEVIGARSGKTAYSYSIAHDIISLFFNDRRLVQKTPGLLVVESKVVNWNTNDSSLINFREMPDGSLDVVDRTQEFVSDFYAPGRDYFLERIESRWAKQAMFHWLKADLRTTFSPPLHVSGDTVSGYSASPASEREIGWRPENWIVESGAFKPLPGERQPALKIRAKGSNAYWHTERFVASHSDARIIVRFGARNSVTPSRHRVWIFEDGSYRSVGEFVSGSDWRTFEIPITTNKGSTLEFQIDQPDDWQSLSIRDFQVIGGGPLPVTGRAPVAISMEEWTGSGAPCTQSVGEIQGCRQWPVGGKAGFVQTPMLPPPGEGGLLIHFEARTDRPATTFTPVYLFEGDKYRVVTQYAFGAEWREFSLLLRPSRGVPIKLQVDYPDSVDTLSIRNFQATPVAPVRLTETSHAG